MFAEEIRIRLRSVVKNKKEIVSEKAVQHFREGYYCAQSILLAMFELWNEKNELVPKVATAFGGGIGRCGSVCGALTGGVMAIGARFGTNGPLIEKRLHSYEIAQDFFRKFELQNGSALCRELIGYDLSIPKELERARKAEIFENKCSKIVKNAVEILVALTEAQ